MRLTVPAVALLVAPLLSAGPVITSVSPASGPAGGGTSVTITGTGFSTCVLCSPPTPPAVYFNNTPAASVTLVSDTTLEVRTPPRRQGPTTVVVDQWDGRATKPNAFTFTGDMFAGLEPILLPVFGPPVRGQFGSEFRSSAAVAHRGNGGRVLLFGVYEPCGEVMPIRSPYDPAAVEPHGDTIDLAPACNPTPGRVLWVRAGEAGNVAFNLRVRDVSRSDLSHGVEIPVVRLSEFTREAVTLLKVPSDPRFRNTLRIYGLQPTDVLVTIGGRDHVVTLRPGVWEFEPVFAMFTEFPFVAGESIKVTVRPLTPITSPPTPTVPIWAFITVTNNETQEITTITPN